ncbi:acyltransferase family protein [Prevotella sp. SGI.167]|uniref:acyltransferase family protein n=1 Tax=Prevotella sp. SGI.167 TaxID=3420566 RepID=UPI0040408EC3
MNRLKSLDVMRGLTVALMILVNNGGEHNYSFLEHSKWNGLTPCDLVFPFFLFMMGMSTFLSLKKTEFKPSAAIYRKIAKRTILLFLIGLGINWFDMICNGGGLDFAHLRIWAVLQRIAICYGVVALLAITLNHRYFIHTIIGLLVVYMGILVFGNGYAYDASTNILAQVDRSIFGINHLYQRSPVDPEGLLSTIPSIAHTMIGFLCCKYISVAGQTVDSKIKVLKVAGLVMVALGFGLSLIGFGINKRIWSPSYVFVTCGFASWILGILLQFIDNKPSSKDNILTKGLLAFGMNPLFLYVMSEALAILFGSFDIKAEIFIGIQSVISDEYVASLTYALFFVAIHAAMGIWMYHRKIFIKL